MDNDELLSTATRMAEINMSLQQLQAKYKILMTAIEPFEIKMLQVWQKNVEDMIDSSNIQHLSGLSLLLSQIVRAREFITKFEADIAEKSKEIARGTVQAN